MKLLSLLIPVLLIPYFGFTQISDTLYVDEVDTVIVNQNPVIVNKTIYIPPPSAPKKIDVILDGGILYDFEYVDVCQACKENYIKLKEASKITRSSQTAIRIHYFKKKYSIGFQLNYRKSMKSIQYNDSVITINNKTIVDYLMIGPSFGYKVLDKIKWDLTLYGSVNFSFTLNQSGYTIGGEDINEQINISNKPIYADKNIVYQLSPTFTYKIAKQIGMTTSLNYYLDNNSNISKFQSYTQQRNSLGLSLGMKYLI